MFNLIIDFGRFWLRLDTEGSDTVEAVNANSITGAMARFNAGKEFKKVLDIIEYTKGSELPLPASD